MAWMTKKLGSIPGRVRKFSLLPTIPTDTEYKGPLSQEKSGWDMKLTTLVHPVQRL
jgi:hypothetical protein